MKNIFKLCIITMMLLILCSCKSERLYSKRKFIDILNQKYNTEFVVLNRNKLNNREIQYQLALKNNKDITFTVNNQLVITGSDIGPSTNTIDDYEIQNYFKSQYYYDEQTAEEKISKYLSSKYKEIFDIQIDPTFYCKDGSNMCGYDGLAYLTGTFTDCKVSIDNEYSITDTCDEIISQNN